MLATIRNCALIVVLFGSGVLLTSCASQKQTALIDDPNAKKDTALPWNEQQKWEREGEASQMNQQRR